MSSTPANSTPSIQAQATDLSVPSTLQDSSSAPTLTAASFSASSAASSAASSSTSATTFSSIKNRRPGSRPYIMLVLSDLHLDAPSGAQQQSETSFAKLLTFLDEKVMEEDRYVILVLNGDIYELWSWPMDDADPPFTIPDLIRKSGGDGSQTQRFHNKLKEIKAVKAEALRIVYIRGNHDSFVEEDQFPRELGIEFHSDYFELDHVHIEHGHLIDAFNSVCMPRTSAVAREKVAEYLPLGYFIARYATSLHYKSPDAFGRKILNACHRWVAKELQRRISFIDAALVNASVIYDFQFAMKYVFDKIRKESFHNSSSPLPNVFGGTGRLLGRLAGRDASSHYVDFSLADVYSCYADMIGGLRDKVGQQASTAKKQKEMRKAYIDAARENYVRWFNIWNQTACDAMLCVNHSEKQTEIHLYVIGHTHAPVVERHKDTYMGFANSGTWVEEDKCSYLTITIESHRPTRIDLHLMGRPYRGGINGRSVPDVSHNETLMWQVVSEMSTANATSRTPQENGFHGEFAKEKGDESCLDADVEVYFHPSDSEDEQIEREIAQFHYQPDANIKIPNPEPPSPIDEELASKVLTELHGHSGS